MSGAGFAQEAAPPISEVQEIMVTATRRTEPLQKVPVAISVVDGDYARNNNLNDIADIAGLLPSFSFRTAASNKDEGLIVRGLGTISTSPGVEPTVSTVIDGVVFARQGQATMDLLDIDHIELLKGPQGTLFGKNASGGVLNIVGRNPTNEFSGFADASYYFGNGNEERIRAGVSGPVVPNLILASLTGLVGHWDGNVTNVFDDETVNGNASGGARAKVEFLPSDDLQVTVIADYTHSSANVPNGVVERTYLTAYPTNKITSFPAFAAALSPVSPGMDNTDINSNYDTSVHDDNGGISAQLDWALGGYQLTSISAWRKWDNTELQDQSRLPGAFTGLPEEHDRGDLAFNQESEEVRLTSPLGGFFDYVAGLYYMRAEDQEQYRRSTVVVSGKTETGYTGAAAYGTTGNSYSVFGEGTFHFSDRFRGIAGFRLVRDDLSYHFQRLSSSAVSEPGIQTSFTSSGSTQRNGVADRFGVQYDAWDSGMVYATVSRGYKGPAYNVAFSMLPQDAGALKGEVSNAYEAGLKSRFLDDMLQLDMAAFLDRLSDYQVNFADTYNGSPVTRLINAGRVSTRGIELDATVRPVKNLSLTLTGARIDARVDDFNCPVGTNSSCNIDGKPLPFAPKWKMDAQIDYAIPLGNGLTFDLASNYTWQSSTQYSINQTPDTIQPAYGIWNANISLTTEHDLRFAFIVKNILDQHYSSQLADISSAVVRFVPRDDERYFGLNVRQKF